MVITRTAYSSADRRRPSPAFTAVGLVLACALLATGCSSDSDGQGPGTSTASAEQPTDQLVVNVGTEIEPINRDLLGIHAKASAASIAEDFDDLAPQTHRHVMSAADFMHYDCDTATVDQSSLDYFNDWLDAAIDAVEQASGLDLRVGTPAAFSPWPFSRYGEDLTELLVNVNRLDPEEVAGLSAAANTLFAEPHLPAANERILGNGGFTWPRRVIDQAADLGLEIDFVSVHLYPNNPLQGSVEVGGAEPQVLRGRNRFASPDDFGELASTWSEEFPDLELVVSEWSLSAGTEWRHTTCEGAAFNAAAMSVMQNSPIDRALFLGRPPAPADAAMRTWAALPDIQVEATTPAGSDDIWITAAHDDERTTVLVSQWHSELVDASVVELPVRLVGLDDGPYVVEVSWLGHGAEVVPGSRTSESTSSEGILQLDEDITLAGQSVVRLDVRRPDAESLEPLTAPPGDREPGPCLA